MVRGSQTVRCALATLTIAAACTAAAIPSTSLRASVRGADSDLSLLQQRVDRLDALTQRVEAVSAIKRLQHAYGHYSELGLWHDFADLFADTGIGHYTQGALDREGIRALFLKDVGGGQLGLADGRIYPHISMQPVVTLAADGQSGKGRWHIMAMLGGYERSASWAGGVYENEYVRENGVWKFKDVRYLPQYSGDMTIPAGPPRTSRLHFISTRRASANPFSMCPARGRDYTAHARHTSEALVGSRRTCPATRRRDRGHESPARVRLLRRSEDVGRRRGFVRR